MQLLSMRISGLLAAFNLKALACDLWGWGFQLMMRSEFQGLSLRLKTAQKPYIVWSLGPKAFQYEPLEPIRV